MGASHACPGNANLPIGVIQAANREIGVPGLLRPESYCAGLEDGGAADAGADASFGPKFLARY
jgi:hypothetical protein